MSAPTDYAPSPDLLALVSAEMQHQRAKWGEQNHPDLSPAAGITGTITSREYAASVWLRVPTESAAKNCCEWAVNTGNLDWGLILAEEVAEAVAAAARGDTEALKVELVQVAAVCMSWVEAIGRRGGR